MPQVVVSFHKQLQNPECQRCKEINQYHLPQHADKFAGLCLACVVVATAVLFSQCQATLRGVGVFIEHTYPT